MKNLIEILKQILFLISTFFLDVIKMAWEPLLTKFLKISVISLIIYIIAVFVPHNIDIISSISYLGWVSLYCIINLLTYKLDETIDFDVNSLNKNAEEDDIEIENDEPALIDVKDIKFLNDNISTTTTNKDDKNGTTRE